MNAKQLAEEECREIVLQILPGESNEDYTSRIADTAPAPPDVLDRIRTLLVPATHHTPATQVATRRHTALGDAA